VSFIVALAVVKGFVAIVSRFGFAPFAWYRIIVGSVRWSGCWQDRAVSGHNLFDFLESYSH
jgi:hypothetical protein